MIRSAAAGLAVFLCVSLAVTPALAVFDGGRVGTTGGPPGGAADLAVGGTSLATPSGFTRTVFSVRVYDNATAQWTFQYSRPLENQSERETFETFATEFERNQSQLYRNFVNRSRNLVEAGSAATGREMSASTFSRSARVEEFPAQRGIVSLSFSWSNFGVQDGEAVRLGDVFEGGLYLGENQRLVFETGPSMVITRAEPRSYTPSGRTLRSSDSVTWVGQRQFVDEHPKVVYRPDVEPANGTPGGDGPDGTATTEPAARSSTDMLLLVGVLVVVIGLVGAAVWQSGALSRRGLGRGGTSAAGSASESADADGENAPIPDEELVSDSDRVRRLLRDNGGRMKQVNIVEETEWSKSKVSMLLSEMEDEGEISKLRVGRENIISLAGHEPDAAGSPFDDED